MVGLKDTTKRADWQRNCTSSPFRVYWAVETTTPADEYRASRADWYRRVHAWMLSRENGRYASIMSPRKRSLLGGLEGTIVELGPGGGHNLRFFRPTVQWIGIEPNPHAHRYIRDEARKAGVTARILAGRGEDIPLPDATADAVVSTLVLCSVNDPRRVLAEVLRVLKPGGTFAFVEHVAAPEETGMRTIQRMIRPCWRLIADGCNPDRETWRFLEAAGFENLAIDHFKVSLAVTAPHIAGRGTKPQYQHP